MIEHNARIEKTDSPGRRTLGASELSYRRLFEAAKDGILILEADTGRISDANPFLADLLGFRRDELVGKPIWEIGQLRDIVSNKAKFEELQRQGYVRYDNLPLKARDGRTIPVEFVSNAYAAGDRTVIQCNIRDITKRRGLEERILNLNAELEQRVLGRTAQLLSANEDLEAFGYSISHDLQAPLRHITGYVRLLEKEALHSLSGQGLDYLKTISDAAERMGALIDDLLAFSHVGSAGLRKADVDLDKLVRETVGELQADIKGRNIDWKVHPLPSVRADRALLKMVFVNLISNALKFTGRRAEARIEVGRTPSGDGETVIFVRDNGAGFDPQYGWKLFGVFQRLHSRAEFEGTGIGLANVKRIIQRHGGRVWAEGEVNRGATFYLSIPNQAAGKDAGGDAAPIRRGKGA